MKKFYALFLSLFICSLIQAQPFYERFSTYQVGSALASNGTWTQCITGPGVLKINPTNLTYTGFATNDTANSIYYDPSMSNPGGYCNTFPAFGSGSVYIAFLFNDSIVAVNPNPGDYFLSLGSGALSHAGRVLFKSSGSTYQIGVRKSNGSDAYYSNLYSSGQTHLIVMKYVFNTGSGTDDLVGLYIDPTPGNPEPGSFTVQANPTTDFVGSISNVLLRMDMGAANMPQAHIDAIKVDTSWSGLMYFPPVCGLVASFTDSISGMDVSFTNTSTGNYIASLWDFGDGTNSNQTSPTHTYASSGTYTVCLNLRDSSGNFCASTCTTITVTSPTCNGVASFTYIINGQTVNFTNTTTGSYSSLIWSFGDNQNSNVNSPGHTYTNPGIYNVCLYLRDVNGSFCDTSCVTINVGNYVPCNATASFGYSANLTSLTFANTSTGTWFGQHWDFGDGDTSSLSNPVHNYPVPGNYGVCLTLYDSLGLLCDSSCTTISVTGPPCNSVAGFTYAVSGYTVNFTNTTTGTFGPVTWSFGDASSSSQLSPSHTYTATGAFTVCLTVRDTFGAFCDSACATVTITAAGCNGVNASFTSSTSGLSAMFTNTTTGTIGSNSWTFGDGGTSSQTSPSHTYASAGSYAVCLIVRDTSGAFCDSSCTTVTVTSGGGNPCVNAVSDFTFSTNNLTANFTNTSTGTWSTQDWKFGDGNVATTTNASHTYAANGTYNVCLYLKDGGGAVCDTTCHSVTVNLLGTGTGISDIEKIYIPENANLLVLISTAAARGEIQIHDLSGKLVFSHELSEIHPGRNEVTLPALPAGVYVARAEWNGIIRYSKFVGRN